MGRRRLAVLVVLNLALGLGATIAIFSVADALLFRPLPYPAAQELVTLHDGVVPKGYYVGLRRRVRAMELAAYSPGAALNLEQQGNLFSLHGSVVSTNFFQVLGVKATLGGGFQAGEDEPGQDGEVVLSTPLWKQRFGSRPGIIGQQIALGGRERRVVGVMPASFRFPSDATEFWVPMLLDPNQMQDYWGTYAFEVLGRLRPGVSLAAARADFARVATQAVGDFPYPVASNYASAYPVVSLRTELFGDMRTTLLLILGAAGLVLLIACANAANLLLTQFAGLRRDTAVRLALGAGQARMRRWFLARSVRLALIGGACGWLLAFWTLPVLLHWLPSDATAPVAIGLNARALLFAIGASLLAGLVSGLVPAWRSSRANLSQDLRGGSAAEPPGRLPLAAALLMGELALAVVVVVAGVLLARSLRTLTRQNPGFQAADVVTMRLHPTPAFCAAPQTCAAFYRQVRQSVAALPGVRGAAFVNAAPLGGLAATAAVVFSNHPLLPGKQVPLIWANVISPGYLATAGIPLLQGRGFTSSDGVSAQRVALINASLAAKLWLHASPLGKQVTTLTPGLVPWTIVGVVRNVREMQLQGDPGFYQGEVYFPLAQAMANPPLAGSMADLTLLLRSPAPPGAAVLRRTIMALNPQVAVDPPRRLSALVYANIAGPRTTAWLFEMFAALALAMSMLGVYAVMGESVRQRQREFGVRTALGAGAASVLGLVLQRGLMFAAAGVAAGLIAAWALSRVLASLLFHVSPADPLSYAAGAVVVLAVAAFASFWPARRATRVDPVVVLRGE